jgi:hypothetical protein
VSNQHHRLVFFIVNVVEAFVIKKTVLLIFAVVILQCAMSRGAAAQNVDPCLFVMTWWFPDPFPPGWFYYAPYPAPLSFPLGLNRTKPRKG